MADATAKEALAYAFRHASGNTFQISQPTAERIAQEMIDLLARDRFEVAPSGSSEKLPAVAHRDSLRAERRGSQVPGQREALLEQAARDVVAWLSTWLDRPQLANVCIKHLEDALSHPKVDQ